MDLLKSVSGRAKQLTEVVIRVIALGVVLEVLLRRAVPLLGDFQVVTNIMVILN